MKPAIANDTIIGICGRTVSIAKEAWQFILNAVNGFVLRGKAGMLCFICLSTFKGRNEINNVSGET